MKLNQTRGKQIDLYLPELPSTEVLTMKVVCFELFLIVSPLNKINVHEQGRELFSVSAVCY